MSLGLMLHISAILITLIINISAILYLQPEYYKSTVMLRFAILTSLSSIFLLIFMYECGNKLIQISKANDVT